MINVICGVIFVLFCIGFLLGFQADYLSLVQHYYSNGKNVTHGIGLPLLATGVLTVIGTLMQVFFHLPIRLRALCWLPSCICLAFLCNFSMPPFVSAESVSGLTPFLLFFILFVGIFVIALSVRESKSENTSFFVLAWPNFIVLLVGFSFVGLFSNTDVLLHKELRIEKAIGEERYDRALQQLTAVNEPTDCMVAMGAFVLSKKGELGDSLFYYANANGSAALFPHNIDSLRPWNITAMVREELGGFPGTDMAPTRFLEYLAKDTIVSPAVSDYLLTAYLLDREFEKFANKLVEVYPPADSISHVYQAFDSLPANYAEALCLYNVLEEEEALVQLDDSLLLLRYQGFNKLKSTILKPAVRKEECKKQYLGTYWYYYFFMKED